MSVAVDKRVAEAPNVVSLLCRFVLDLAVRGKVVKQNPADGSASELLERISLACSYAGPTPSVPCFAVSDPLELDNKFGGLS